MWSIIRNTPPSVVTMLAGGMCIDFSPAAFVAIDGQQLSATVVELETPVSILQEPHPTDSQTTRSEDVAV